ncbi:MULTISPECIES: prepilin-type N-terminal cleavage/methylation domain-containing protein [unclassified Leucobacter]|uniref:prepilin-type N-terminal cleavage/methylation domain-containing protein n=1 Tax=unclassified Leucobacter TaxID=2621730 RepID=UPI00165DBAE6|nr:MULTISPECIES: prepilin-type N-terminal cleavage/methylation domain-containing protein [unclassified Leucobacter]MBC9935578.1 prepilin-type N-terminal cleavage/methylation domain-containing protein [Leucobacter sp. cx-87]
MLERIKNALQERKRDDKGFSLVELAVVIVIIGILVAIAVPVFMGIQDGARKSQVEAAAANGSAMVAGHIASGAAGSVSLDSLKTGDVTSVTVANATALDTYCVTATSAKYTAKKGPAAGCSGVTATTTP